VINKILQGDALQVLKTLKDETVNCCVTSPPYWGLRDYGHNGQIGLEKTPELYVDKLVKIFQEVKRVLKKDGTLWLNLGDNYIGGGRGGLEQCGKGSFEESRYKKGQKIGLPTGKVAGYKPKDLVGLPWMVAFALRADGWYLRSDIIWSKKNPMPESVTDRPTKAHEYIFLMSKSSKYYYDADVIKENQVTDINTKANQTFGAAGGKAEKVYGRKVSGKKWEPNGNRNKRSVWQVNTQPYPDAHFAVYPVNLIVPCIKAGCPKDGIVLDPFFGSGTTGEVARRLDRNFIGIELNPEYIILAEKRIEKTKMPLFEAK